MEPPLGSKSLFAKSYNFINGVNTSPDRLLGIKKSLIDLWLSMGTKDSGACDQLENGFQDV